MSSGAGNKFSKRNILYLIVLTIVVGISYGIGISRLSFYGDDWIYIYNYHLAGPESFSLFTQWDRPHSAWIYVLTSAVFKESALAYHIFVLFLRWLSALLFWRVLAAAFGERRSVYLAPLLFATYPGFQQQPIAVEFVMHFTSLVLVLLSLWLMQHAYFSPRGKMILLMILSLAVGALSIFTCEYFLGLELARPLFLYFTAHTHENKEKYSKPTKKMLLFELPFLCVTAFFFIWRIFIFSFTTYAPKLLNALQENFLNGVRLLITKVVQDLITVSAASYRMIFSRPSLVPMPAVITILLLIGAAVLLHFYIYTKLFSDKTESKKPGGMLLTGIALLLFSGIPFWGTFLDVSTEFPWDRSTLSFSPGVAVIIALLLDAAFKPLFFCVTAALVTALSALFQVQNTYVYISEADKMNDYFWQLAWRAPGLESGTILASEDIPLNRTSDNDLSPVVNWQYAPENRGLHYDYKYFDLHLREGFYYTNPAVSVPVDHTYRTHSFTSSTDKTLGIFYKKGGCLQIIDSTNTGYPDLPDSLIRIAAISDKNLIQTEPETPAQPPAPIGKEPHHGYCYYFQKITLEQQNGNRDKAHALAVQALQDDVHPLYAPDLAPVVLAFLDAGDIQSAETLIAATPIGSGDVDYLCTYWQDRLSDQPLTEELNNFYKRHKCL